MGFGYRVPSLIMQKKWNMVVFLNRWTPRLTPKCYDPYYMDPPSVP